MSEISLVTIGLIEKRPLTAVRTVMKMDPGDAAAFVETLPTRHAVLIISKMSSWSASALISRMTPVSGAAVLSELDYQITASIMRIIVESDRVKLLDALPKRLKRDLKSTLTYPADTVGAKMSTTIVVMRADQTAADALAELREIKRTKTGVAYVVDESKKLMGVVNAEELLQRPNDAVLGEVIDRSVSPISARARLSGISSLPEWDDYAHMPVVNRQKILIGSLARRALRQAVDETPASTSEHRAPSILATVAGAFASAAIGLAGVLIRVEAKPNQTASGSSQRVKGGKV